MILFLYGIMIGGAAGGFIGWVAGSANHKNSRPTIYHYEVRIEKRGPSVEKNNWILERVFYFDGPGTHESPFGETRVGLRVLNS